MKVYVPFSSIEDDLVLLSWWKLVKDANELEQTFGQNGDTLTGFFHIWSNGQVQLAIDTDANGPTIAVWIERLGFPSIAMVGLWVRPDKRTAPSTLKTLLRVYDHLFQYEGIEVITGITRREEILAEHERLGYTVSAKLPRVWLGKDAWLVTLTKDAFYTSRLTVRYNKAA